MGCVLTDLRYQQLSFWYENLSDTSLYPNVNYEYFYAIRCTFFKAVESYRKPSHCTVGLPLYKGWRAIWKWLSYLSQGLQHLFYWFGNCCGWYMDLSEVGGLLGLGIWEPKRKFEKDRKKDHIAGVYPSHKFEWGFLARLRGLWISVFLSGFLINLRGFDHDFWPKLGDLNDAYLSTIWDIWGVPDTLGTLHGYSPALVFYMYHYKYWKSTYNISYPDMALLSKSQRVFQIKIQMVFSISTLKTVKHLAFMRHILCIVLSHCTLLPLQQWSNVPKKPLLFGHLLILIK